MAFIEKSDKYQKWKYVVSELFVLYSDGSQTTIPSRNVQSMSITHLFEQNLFPIFKLEVVLSSQIYYKIIKNKNDVKFKLRIQKFYTDIDNAEKSLQRDFINDTFDLILDDDDFDKEESLKKEQKELDYRYVSDKHSENDLFEVDNLMEFFLFKSEYVDKLNSMVNAIITDATINDGIQYIATNAGLTNLLMTVPHNRTTYKELVIPPLKTKQAIKFLDTYYGLYKTGMMFYCDMIDDITYLLDYSPKCTAYQNKELKETNIMIPKKSNKYASNLLCSLYRRDNKETYFIIGDNNRIAIRNESVSYNAYDNTDVKIIDTYDGNITTSNSTAIVKDNKSVKIIENNTENPWFSDIYNSLIKGKNVVIEVPLANYDISAVTPNKAFKLVFEDSALSIKYKGNCILSEIAHAFVKEGEAFTLTSIAKLRLI
jgi:hypothetical protein